MMTCGMDIERGNVKVVFESIPVDSFRFVRFKPVRAILLQLGSIQAYRTRIQLRFNTQIWLIVHSDQHSLYWADSNRRQFQMNSRATEIQEFSRNFRIFQYFSLISIRGMNDS